METPYIQPEDHKSNVLLYGSECWRVIEKDNRRLNLLPCTSPVSGESCECSGLIKSPMLAFYMPQDRKGWELSYSEDDGDGLAMC